MLYARQPTDEERKELERMTRQEVGRVSQRARMILLSVRRKTIPEIADIFEVDCATVRFWIHRFNADGPDGLYDQERSGRPRKVTQEVKDAIIEMVQDDPQKEGYLATSWTVAMLVLALTNKLKVTLSLSGCVGCCIRLICAGGVPAWGCPTR